MRPPVALLVYAPEPRVATFYPFAEFSPEWVALRWALEHDIPARFIDLSAGAQMAVAEAEFERAWPKRSPPPRPRTPKQGRGLTANRTRPPRPADRARPAAGGRRALVGPPGRVATRSRRPVRGGLRGNDRRPRCRARRRQPHPPARGSNARGIRQAAKDGFPTSPSCVAPGTRPRSRSCRPPPRTIERSRPCKAIEDRGRLGAVDVRPPGRGVRLRRRRRVARLVRTPLVRRGTARRFVDGPRRALFREEGMDASAAHLVEAVRRPRPAAMRGRAVPSLSELNEAVAPASRWVRTASGSCATA